MSNSTTSRRPRRRSVLAAVAVTLLVGGLQLVDTHPVSAAQIDGAVQDITVSPTNPAPNDLIRTTVDWCVPDGIQGGDFFTISIPEQFQGLPPTFELRDRSGQLVANGTIAGSAPPIATITLTDYVETRVGICGDAYFNARMDAQEVAGTTQTLVYTVNGDLTFEETIEVSDSLAPVRERSSKRGEFTDPDDQCRTDTTNCIEWVLTSRLGPYESVTFNDVAIDGLSFSCDDLSVVIWSVNPDGTREDAFAPADLGATVQTDCDPSELTLTVGPIPASHLVRLRLPATPDVPAGGAGGDYSNIATITHDTGDGVIVDDVGSESRSASAGGSASGDSIDIEKYDTDGNDADTAADAVNVPNGTADIVFTITNDGGDDLIDVEVSDVVLDGDATVEGLTCDFSIAEAGAPTSGTTWAGPFAPGASFDCTATLAGVDVGDPHADEATVVGIGDTSGETVTDRDQYHANRTSTTTTAPATTTTTPGVTTTSLVVGPPSTTTPPPLTSLPVTGSSSGTMVGLAIGLLASGALLAGFAARRRPSDLS
jgi:hypothetical protein